MLIYLIENNLLKVEAINQPTLPMIYNHIPEPKYRMADDQLWTRRANHALVVLGLLVAAAAAITLAFIWAHPAG